MIARNLCSQVEPLRDSEMGPTSPSYFRSSYSTSCRDHVGPLPFEEQLLERNHFVARWHLWHDVHFIRFRCSLKFTFTVEEPNSFLEVFIPSMFSMELMAFLKALISSSPSRELILFLEALILPLSLRELIPFLEVLIPSLPFEELIPFSRH